MIARLQQALTLSLFGIALGLAVWLALRGHPWAGVAAGLASVFAYAAVLAIETVLLRFVHGDDPAPRARPLQLLKAWWGEVQTGPRVFYWRQPFRHRAFPDYLPPEAHGRHGLLLVHGFVCNRGLWNPWLRRLRQAGVPYVAVSMEPVQGPIDAYVPTLAAAAQQLQQATGLAPVVVAHSMGGLAVRAWLRATSDDTEVRRVVTIGTPHHGTWLGRFGQLPNTRQMRLGSRWLQALAATEPASRRARFTCFYSHCDNIVFPPSTATLPGADNRHLEGWSHVHLAFHPAVFDEVMRWLAPSQAARPGASDPARCSRTAP